MVQTTQTQTAGSTDFMSLVEKILGLLTDKERDIIERRFAIRRDKKETLDRIGKSYSITRERVRQIQAVAIQKLMRISQDPAMQKIHNIAIDILNKNGRVMAEDQLISAMLTQIEGGNKVSANALKFSLSVCPKLGKQEKNQFYRAFWFTNDMRLQELKILVKNIQSAFEKRKEISTFDEVYDLLKNPPARETIQSLFYTDWNIMEVEKGTWGLKSWRFLNPRSIKDCIMIVLNEEQKPIHFRDILHKLLTEFPNRKAVTPQACHNELIRHGDFVLLGRGKYGLKEWGMAAGTVCDLICSVFEDNNYEPLKRKEIIEKVLEKREVRLGTISLNLQKYDFFERVGRAVYSYNQANDTRRRRKYSTNNNKPE